MLNNVDWSERGIREFRYKPSQSNKLTKQLSLTTEQMSIDKKIAVKVLRYR